MTDARVLICGAGPAGLALALRLQEAKISFLLLDAQSKGANTSRAAVVHARTLEALECVGVTSALLAEGLPISDFTVRDREKDLLTLSFRKLPTKYPFALMIPQNRTEFLLEEELVKRGGRVERETSLVSFTTGEGGRITAKTSTGKTLTADFLVGADGMHSTVREQAGIGFEGGTYAQGFALADVKMEWPFGRKEVSLLLAPAGLVVIAPLPQGTFRVVATMDDAPEKPSVQDVQKLLLERGPRDKTARVQEVLWSSRFRVHHRVAGQLRKGSVLLIGDAAHVHSPAGGQGMNTGIQDAISLGNALAADGSLATWEKQRLRVAHDVVSLTDRLTVLATGKNFGVRWLRNMALRTLNHVPPLQQMLAVNVAELKNPL